MYNISLRRKYFQLEDDDLDTLVAKYVEGNAALGANSVQARLKGQGIIVQRQRVRDSLLRLDPAGVAQRSLSSPLERRVYSVPGPNFCWHMDGNHKLIR